MSLDLRVSVGSIFVVFYCCADHRDLHSFPTRRSSDLGRYLRKFYPWYVERLGGDKRLQAALQSAGSFEEVRELVWNFVSRRSEEHTSELQSQSNLVCRLLLEKKKQTTRSNHDTIHARP